MAPATGRTRNIYVYETAGNRTQQVISGAQTDFVYNDVNEMTTRSGAQWVATFFYDLNGSLTNDGAKTFEWDGQASMVGPVLSPAILKSLGEFGVELFIDSYFRLETKRETKRTTKRDRKKIPARGNRS